MSHWRDKIVPLDARNLASAVSAMQYVLRMGYQTALETELDVCLHPCRNDAERAQVFLWLMPHLESQIRQKVKEDGQRFRNRIYSRRIR